MSEKSIQPVGEIAGLKVYSIADLSEMLSLQCRTLTKYIREGKLKAVKIGGKWFVSEDNLREYLNGK